MLSFIKEKDTLWSYLKTVKKPIVLYGTGDGAEKILQQLAKKNISVSEIFVSDEFFRGQEFCGFTVHKYSELEALNEAVVVLIAFASEQPALLERFSLLAQFQETYAPHIPLFSDDEDEIFTFEWLNKNEADIQKVYDSLADDLSRKVFAAMLNYKLSGKIAYLQECVTQRETDLNVLFHFDSPGVYVDAGAYDGDTIKEFLRLSEGKYKKIYAIEPDPKNFSRLKNIVMQEGLINVATIQAGAWSRKAEKILSGNGGRQSTLILSSALAIEKKEPMLEKNAVTFKFTNTEREKINRRKKMEQHVVLLDSIDNIVQEEFADYIKLDVEGAEREALLGAAQHLSKKISGKLPQLLIAAYHHDRDIISLPLLLWKLQPDYKIYLRKHPYVPAWEINFFAC